VETCTNSEKKRGGEGKDTNETTGARKWNEEKLLKVKGQAGKSLRKKIRKQSRQPERARRSGISYRHSRNRTKKKKEPESCYIGIKKVEISLDQTIDKRVEKGVVEAMTGEPKEQLTQEV